MVVVEESNFVHGILIDPDGKLDIADSFEAECIFEHVFATDIFVLQFLDAVFVDVQVVLLEEFVGDDKGAYFL